MRIPAESEQKVRFAEFELDLRTRELQNGHAKVILQEQPFQVLATLLERPGQLFTRDELTKRLWPSNTFVDFEHSLNKAVNRLREALEDSADNPRLIETLPRRGYRLMVPVESTGSPGATAPEGGLPAALSRIEAQKWSARNFLSQVVARPWTKAALVFLAIALATLVYGVRRHAVLVRPPVLQDLQFTRLTESGKVEDVAISPNGSYLAYLYGDGRGWDQVDGWEGARSSLRLRQVATSSEVILVKDAELYPGLSFSPDGNYIYFLRKRGENQDVRDLHQIPALGGAEKKLLNDIDTPVSFSPDGRRLSYLKQNSDVHRIELHTADADGATDQVIAISDEWTFPMATSWSPDGQRIAVSWFHFGSTARFFLDVISIADGKRRTLFATSEAIGRAHWIANGSMLLVPRQDQYRRGQLWTVSYPGGEAHPLTNDASNYDLSVDTTPDGRTLAAMLLAVSSDLEVADVSDLSNPRPLPSGELPVFNVLPLPNGQWLTLRGGDRELWEMNPDGTQLHALAGLRELVWPARCGGYLVFTSRNTVTRTDLDGGNVKALATGWSPVCSADGQSVFYADLSQPLGKIRRIPIDGGPASDLVDVPGRGISGLLSISPDGEWLAFPFDEAGSRPAEKIAIVHIRENAITNILHPAGNVNGGPRWSPDGKSLQYLLDRDGATNVWEQPAGGGPSHQLTRFHAGKIFDFQWSLDGKELLLCRGAVSSDAILIRDPH